MGKDSDVLAYGGEGMLSRQQGFSLLEILIAMAIGSVLLLASARFLPALQQSVMRHTRMQVVEDELWLRAWTVAKHLQRAGFCNGNCSGQPLVISNSRECVIVQWDANSNGRWESPDHVESEQTGFRLNNGALETQRGASSCTSQGWEKITDPAQMRIEHFNVAVRKMPPFAPLLTISLSARVPGNKEKEMTAVLSVTGYNL